MGAGGAIVASRVGQIGEVLADEQTALLVEPDEPRALTDAIVRLVSDPGLRLLARGFSNRIMAKRLTLSYDTVKHHIQHIYDKAGVSTRAGATLFAMEHSLL